MTGDISDRDVEEVVREIDLSDLQQMRDRERRTDMPSELDYPLPLVAKAMASIQDDRRREQATAVFRMLVNQRQGKIVKLASLAAAGQSIGDDSVEQFTMREQDLFYRLRDELRGARADLLDAVALPSEQRPDGVEQFELDADYSGVVADGD